MVGQAFAFSILFLYYLVLVIQLEVMAAFDALSEKTLHFILIKVNSAVVAEFIIGDIVRALFAAVSHHLPPYLSYSKAVYPSRNAKISSSFSAT